LFQHFIFNFFFFFFFGRKKKILKLDRELLCHIGKVLKNYVMGRVTNDHISIYKLFLKKKKKREKERHKD
jgi:hypothetical protein